MARWNPAAWATCGEPDHPAGRAGKDAVFSHERVGVDQPAGRGEDLQPPRAERLAEPVDVCPQNGIQIRVDDGRVAAGDDFHQRRDAARKADFRKAQLARDAAHKLLVLRMAVGVQQAHGQRLDRPAPQRGQLGTDRRRVGRFQHRAVGRDPLVDFHHRCEQRFRLADRQVEQPRPILIADLEDVAEAARGDQCRRRAAAGEQSVRATGGPQADGDRWNRGRPAQAEQIADSLDRRFFVGQQFIGLPDGRRCVKRLRKPQQCLVRVERGHVGFGRDAALPVEQTEAVAGPVSARVALPRRIDDVPAARTRRQPLPSSLRS